MFVKLIKHDFRSTWGLLGLLSLICLGASLLGSVFLRIMGTGPWDNRLVRTMVVLGFFAVCVYLIAYSLVALFLLLNRFYRSRFTDEGYLTFTLPVTTHQVLLSGIFNCTLGLVFCLIFTLFCFCMFAFFGASDLDGYRLKVVTEILKYLPGFLREVGLGNILLMLLTVFLSILGEILCIMMSITAAALLAKKHRVFMGLAVYYAIHFLLTTVSITYSMRGLFAVEFTQSLYRSLLGEQMLQMTLLSLFSYLVMYFLVKKKLNLN